MAGLGAGRAIAAGGGFTCAATVDGAASCWGRNDLGQLGDGGPPADRLAPAPIPGLTGVTRISASVTAACAVAAGGAVWCWGRPGTVVRPLPEAVAGLPGAAIDVAVGWGGACALLSGGDVWCWGGDGPPAQTAIHGAVAVAVPLDAPCAILQGGAVSCAALPAPPVALSGSQAQACAVLADGVVSCWGDRPFGTPDRFGGEQPFGPEPRATGATAVAVGDGFACALLAAGGVACWGDGWSGQLGDGTDRTRQGAADVTGLPGPATAVAASRGLVVWNYGCGTTAAPDDHLP